MCTCSQELHARITGSKAPAKGKAAKDKAEAAATAQRQGAAANTKQKKRADKQQPTKKGGRPSRKPVKGRER